MVKSARIQPFIRWLLIACLCVFAAFPIAWMISTSLKTPMEIRAYPPVWIPASPSFDGYLNIWAVDAVFNVRFTQWILNSLKITAISTFCAIAIASLAGYSLSRAKFSGGPLLGYLVLITQMLPDVLLLIPLYQLINGFGLIDTHLSLMFVYTALAVPFATWMLRGYFNTIPEELDEAAMVDGTGPFGAYFRVVLPLAMPGIAATSVFSFVLSWNEYLFASVILNTYANWTLPVALASFRGQYIIQWNYLMAGSFVVTFPILLFYLYLQKHIVGGALAGSVKG